MAANPDPARITDAMWNLWESLAVLEPGTQLGGIYAYKPGYHGTRNDNVEWDYSVCDPPDQGGPSDKAAGLDWTFPDAQAGDYSGIALYSKRLLASGQNPNDPRLNGWREFYGNTDDDSYVEGWDFRYGCPVTSDSSHLWHIHLSENRDRVTSQTNKDDLLSVLKGESVEEWGGDVSAEDVWSFDIDPTGNRYSASGAAWTVYQRTDYLANTFAPLVSAQLAQLTEDQTSQARDVYALGERVNTLMMLIVGLVVIVIIAMAVTVLLD